MISPQSPSFTPPNPALWANIPEAMKSLPQWCYATLRLWDEEDAAKKLKAPRNPNSWDERKNRPVLAKPTDPATWGTFARAEAMAKFVGGCVGFIFTANDPFVCLDLDPYKVDRPTGRKVLRDERELKLLEAISNSHADVYRERSQSKKGLHILLAANGPVGFEATQHGGLDVFAQKRFVILTGDVDFFGGPRPMGNDEDVRAVIEQTKPSTGELPSLDPCGPREVADDWALGNLFSSLHTARKKVTDPDTKLDTWIVTDETYGERNRRWHFEGTRIDEDRSACDSAYLGSAVKECRGNWEQALDLFRASRLWRGIGSASPKYQKERHYRHYLEMTLRKILGYYQAEQMERARQMQERISHGKPPPSHIWW